MIRHSGVGATKRSRASRVVFGDPRYGLVDRVDCRRSGFATGVSDASSLTIGREGFDQRSISTTTSERDACFVTLLNPDVLAPGELVVERELIIGPTLVGGHAMGPSIEDEGY